MTEVEVHKEKMFPVVEVFGPTIFGEGPLVGTPVKFVRFGGCEYRCSWCLTGDADIALWDGDYAEIKDIKIGAELAGFDHGTGTFAKTTVVAVDAHLDESGELWAINPQPYNWETVCTGDHRWAVKSYGWCSAAHLEPDSLIYGRSLDGNTVEIQTRTHKIFTLPTMVYDLRCEPHHNFYAGNLLSHNCDSLHAVLPEEVRKAPKLTPYEIWTRLQKLGGMSEWVVLSGGNPVLHKLDTLVDILHTNGQNVAVETQGTAFKSWLRQVDSLAISPKPPSSLMETDWALLDRFVASMAGAYDVNIPHTMYFKIVVFDDIDLEYAATVYQRYEHLHIPFFLSRGTTLTGSEMSLLADTRWLVEKALRHPILGKANILPQVHALIWGLTTQGV